MADTTVRRDVTTADSDAERVEVYNEPIGATRPARKQDRDEHRSQVERDWDERGYLPAAIKRVSWGAIFAGAVVAICLQTLLSLLGLAIGMSTIDPATEANPLGGLATGTGIWLAISTIISFLAGGYVAGRLAGMPRKQDGTLHGIAMWGAVTLFTWYLMTSAFGQILNTTTGVLGRGLEFVGNVAPTAAEVANPQVLQGQPLENVDPDQVQNQIQQALPNVTAQERQQFLDQAAATLSSAALWAFIAGVIGLICGAVGGGMGTPKDLPAGIPAPVPVDTRRL